MSAPIIACSSERSGQFICADGFVQTAACHGVIRCHACGQISAQMPWCLREDVAPHHLNPDGSPRYYLAALTGAKP